jgi:hypothetical protein
MGASSRRAPAGSLLARSVSMLLLAMACTLAFGQTAPSWNTLGPPGGSISALLTHPGTASTLFAATPENGVFESTDAGQTWSASNNGLVGSTAIGRQTLLTVYSLASDGNLLIAATGSGLYDRALAAGSPWTALGGPASTTPIAWLAFDATTTRLYAASNSTDGLSAPGVYVTAFDSSLGAPAPAWTFYPLPLPASASPISAMTLVTTPAGLLVGAGNAAFSAPILSGSPTLTWSSADPSGTLATDVVSALAYSSDFALAYACSGGTVYTSGNPMDTNALWSIASVPASTGVAFNCTGFAPIPFAQGGVPQVALGTDQGAFVSLDGTSFLATGSLGSTTSGNAFAIGTAAGAMSATVYAGTGFGVQVESAPLFVGGANWVASNGPASVSAGGANARLNNTNVVDSAMLGATLYAAAVAPQYVEVFASSDGGANWTATHVTTVLQPFEDLLSLAPDTVHGMLFAGSTQGLLVYATSNGTWATVSAFNAGTVRSLAVSSSSAFAGTDNGLFAVPLSATPATAMPVAAGLSGKAVTALLVTGGNVYAGVIDALGNSLVYVASEASVAAGTANWQAFGTGDLGIQRITSLLLVGNQLLAATAGNLVLVASSGSAWASANTGSTQLLSDHFGVVNSLYSDGTSIYAATANNGMFVSPIASPFAWTSASGSGATMLPSVELHTLRASGTTLYASTRAGIASYAGLAAPVVTPPSTPPASSGGGGGVVGWEFGVLLAAAVVALRRLRRPTRKASQKAFQGPLGESA